MKIKGAKEWRTVVICKKHSEGDKDGCGAELLEIGEEDLLLFKWKGDLFLHYYPSVQCPFCKKYNEVDVPDSIWRRINTEKNQRKAIRL